MSRIRTIQPGFAHSPSMTRVGREARLLFVLLWTVADDEGRTGTADLAALLYPADFDAAVCLAVWLDELERERCIERYAVDGIDYLRVMRWHKHQQIDHPSPSHLPPSPTERPEESRIREASRKRNSRHRNMQQDQELGPRSGVFRENLEKNAEDVPVVVTQQSVLRDLQRIQRNAEADGSHPSAIRSVELAAKIGLLKIGMLSGGNAQNDDDVGPSPADLLAPSDISRSDHG